MQRFASFWASPGPAALRAQARVGTAHRALSLHAKAFHQLTLTDERTDLCWYCNQTQLFSFSFSKATSGGLLASGCTDPMAFHLLLINSQTMLPRADLRHHNIRASWNETAVALSVFISSSAHPQVGMLPASPYPCFQPCGASCQVRVCTGTCQNHHVSYLSNLPLDTLVCFLTGPTNRFLP